jgi:hypothetical protein
MEQHCDWIVHGTAQVGLRGKGCTRMRPKLHLPVLGHALRASGDRSCSSFGRLRAVTHRSIREELDTSPSIPRRQPQLPCDSHGLRLRPSNLLASDPDLSDLTWNASNGRGPKAEPALRLRVRHDRYGDDGHGLRHGYPQTPESPFPPPRFPRLGSKRGRETPFPDSAESGNGKLPVSRFGRERETGPPGAAGRGFGDP